MLYPSDAIWNEAGERYKLLAGGEVLEGEFKLRRKDGAELWCHSVGRALDPKSPETSTIVTYSDTSERHQAERALRKSEAMYRNLVETSNDLIWSVDLGGRWTYLSPAATQRIYGCEPREMVGHEFRDILAQEVTDRDLAVFRRILEGESVFDYQTRHKRGDGSHVDLSFNAVPLRDARGAVIGATGTARDVTAEKAAAAAQYENVEKLRLAVDAAELTYWEWERETDQLHWGRDPSSLVGSAGGRDTRWSEYLASVHPEDRERYLATVNTAWEQAGTCTNEYRVIRSDGRVAWLSSHGKTLADGAGKVYRMIGVSQDITERKRQEEEARFLAYHDTLTGLPNRRLLDDRLRQAVFLAQRRDTRVAVMVVDLDHFKQVNDTAGHAAGDQVLRETAQRLRAAMRTSDLLFRWGGEEFLIMARGAAGLPRNEIANRIVRMMSQAPFDIGTGTPLSKTCSVGFATYPFYSEAPATVPMDTIIELADLALYRAKKTGRNRAVGVSPRSGSPAPGEIWKNRVLENLEKAGVAIEVLEGPAAEKT